MFGRKYSREEKILVGVFIGGAVGSLLTFLFSPVKGEDLRKEIKEDMDEYLGKVKEQSQKIYSETKDITSTIVDRAINVFDLSKKYASGAVEVPRDNIEKEISRLRKAFSAAVDAYKSYEIVEKPAEEVVNELLEEYADDNSPKGEGMGRRHQ